MNIPFLFPSLLSSIIVAVFLIFFRYTTLLKIIIILFTCSSFFLSIIYFASNSFTGAGINDSVIFHLKYVVDLDLISQFWQEFVFFLVSILSVCFFAFYVLSRRTQINSQPSNVLFRAFKTAMPLFLSVFSLCVHPSISDLNKILSYSSNAIDSDLFESLYEPVSISPIADGKSFIYIYAESLERIYFDNYKFPNLVPSLSQLIDERGASVHGIKQMPMTEWTIAGMTASQCGIPLMPFQSSRNDFGMVDSFLPGIDCWGDILSESNYDLYYLGGADLDFANKGLFYKTHGFDFVNGLDEIQNKNNNNLPVSKWGIYDDSLLVMAKKQIYEAVNKDGNFGYVMLTLDTHAPSGFLSPSCTGIKYKTGKSGVLNSVKCADILLAQFIDDLLTDPRLSDVLVVLASDHLVMGNDAGLLSADFSRDNLWVVFNSEEGKVKERLATTLDVAPTFLNLLGFDVNKFGLGTNLFGIEKTLLEQYGPERLETLFFSWRDSFWSFWGDSKKQIHTE